jgi:hypothetical protein
MLITGCPHCDATAEVVHRGTLASTRGPVDMLQVRCVNRHWFLMPGGALRPASDGRDRQPDAPTSPAF